MAEDVCASWRRWTSDDVLTAAARSGSAYDVLVSVTQREVDEGLAWLCHVEYEGGVESAEAEIAEMSRAELERLFALAVIEIMESRADAEREIRRYARRANKRA